MGREPVAEAGAIALDDIPAFEAGLLFEMVATAFRGGEQALVEIAQRVAQGHVQPGEAQRQPLLRFAFRTRRQGDGMRSRPAVRRLRTCIHSKRSSPTLPVSLGVHPMQAPACRWPACMA